MSNAKRKLRYLIALARNELGTVPCDEASRELDALEGEIEQLRAIADAVGVLDGMSSHAHTVLVDKDEFDALHVAWSDWKADEAGGDS